METVSAFALLVGTSALAGLLNVWIWLLSFFAARTSDKTALALAIVYAVVIGALGWVHLLEEPHFSSDNPLAIAWAGAMLPVLFAEFSLLTAFWRWIRKKLKMGPPLGKENSAAES